MFNLIVKIGAWEPSRDSILASRVFESTDERLALRCKPNGKFDFGLLFRIPTLFVEESSRKGDEVARVGTITRARLLGKEVALEYNFDSGIGGIPNKAIEAVATDLDIDKFEFTHTHWAIKEADLFRTLLRIGLPKRAKPTVFRVPEHDPIESKLVAVMMPFASKFDRVYQSLRDVAEAAGFECKRADDIWEDQAVMQDVVSLIHRARVVIADCTGKNPNVFLRNRNRTHAW
jgi:hypothetical protein